MCQSFGYAFDSEIQINFFIVGRNIHIADRPILAVTVAALGLEIVVRKPERQPAPNVCLSAQAARAKPIIVCPSKWVIALVHDDVFGICTSTVGVHVLILFEPGGIWRPADGVFIESQRM